MLYLIKFHKKQENGKGNFTHGKWLKYLSVYTETMKMREVRATDMFSRQNAKLSFMLKLDWKSFWMF